MPRPRLRSGPRCELEAEGALGVGLARAARVGAVVPRHAEPLERPLERGAVEARLAEAAHAGRVEQRVALDEVDELARRAAPVVHLRVRVRVRVIRVRVIRVRVIRVRVIRVRVRVIRVRVRVRVRVGVGVRVIGLG